jgi:hypothetical protein
VSATPDYNARGQIQVEVDDRPLPNVAWPREGRTPEGYMAVMRPVLDSIAPPFVDRGDIFEAVMAAMQDAEEMGGPEGAQYVALMERIAHEAQRRANTMRERLADIAWDVTYSRVPTAYHSPTTTTVRASSEDEACEVVQKAVTDSIVIKTVRRAS